MSALPNYKIIEEIGSGAFGKVYKAYDTTAKKTVALKRIEKFGQQLSREFELLFKIKDCENIVEIQDFFYSKTSKGKVIQNIIFEFMDTDLEAIIEKNEENQTQIKQKEIKGYIYQILKGLAYIHKKGICHRDLKPENILISKQGKAKICDFGSSKVINIQGKNTPYIASQFYRAPELILCISKYTSSIDIWAVGCILAELYLLTPFLEGKNESDQLFAMFRTLGYFSEEQQNYFVQNAPFDRLAFSRMAAKNYQPQDLASKFTNVENFSVFQDLLLKMLEYVPQKRITAVEAIYHPYFDEIRD